MQVVDFAHPVEQVMCIVSHELTRRLLLIHVIGGGLLTSLYAHSQALEVVMAKVTIVVDGMMKSKSGAT